MKKLFTLLLISFSALFLSSCQNEKQYSYYFIGADNWNGGTEEIQEQAARLLISGGYIIPGFNIEGGDIVKNDAQAKVRFQEQAKRLETNLQDIEGALKGTEGAPCTVKFLYTLNRGTDKWSQLDSEVFTLEIAE